MKLVKYGLAKFVTAQALSQALNIAFIAMLARFSGLENLGAYSIIQSCFGLVGLLVGVRLAEPVSKILAENRNDNEAQGIVLGAALQVALAVGLLNFAITLGISQLIIINFYDANINNLSIVLYGFYILFTFPVVTWQSLARHMNQARTLAITSMIDPLVKLAALIVIIYLNLEVSVDNVIFGVFWAGVATFIVSTTSIYIICSSSGVTISFGPRVYGHSKLTHFKSMIGTTFFTDSAHGILTKADLLILGYMSGDSSAGIYRLAKSIFSICSTLISSVRTYWFYDIVKELKDGASGGRISEFFAKHKSLWCAVILLNIVLGFLTWNFSTLIFGSEYVDLKYTYMPFVVTGIVTGITFWVNSLLIATNNYALLSRIVIVNVAVFICLMFPFSYYAGAVGMALLTMLASITQAIATMYFYPNVRNDQ